MGKGGGDIHEALEFMKVSFIATVLNEEKTIGNFFTSILSQSVQPEEIVIVDAGSTDKTTQILAEIIHHIPNKKMREKIRVLVKTGNRSSGRNEAIKRSVNDVIACSDAGCILHKDWIKYITQPFLDSAVDVVAGYYNGLASTVFQKCLVPYVLVMEKQVDPNNFLPASRSIAFRKSAWKDVGGFPEEFSLNEDYVFANLLKRTKKIVFQKDAIAYWIPRENIKEAFKMFYNFAKGDAEARIFRRKVMLIFVRYSLGIILVLYAIFLNQSFSFLVVAGLVLYCLWAIVKNFKYVKHWKAVIILPMLQFISDFAVLSGSIRGIFKR